MEPMENLFVYGTLQEEKIQRAVFGRNLQKRQDFLKGYEKFSIRIPDEASGSFYPAIKPSKNSDNTIPGMLLELKVQELKKADAYEGNSYSRKKVKLESGITAWVYIAGR